MIWWYTACTLIVVSSYVTLIIYILSQWTETPSLGSTDLVGSVTYSFIIPARNEGQKIAACLRSVLVNLDQQIAKAEIIVINDHSEDHTVAEIEALADERIRLIHLSDYISASDKINAYKKIALAKALELAEGEYIIQLDADVLLPKTYLSTIHHAILESGPDLIAGPVLFKSDGSAFQNFQSLDMMGMMAVTAAGINSHKWYMANGANLCYKNGLATYTDDKLASGDDMTTIQKIAIHNRAKIKFLKERAAIVVTACEPSLKSFYDQRIRWATKNKYANGGWIRLMMAIPFINVLWVFVHVIAVIVIGPSALTLLVFHLLAKVGIDYIYLRELSTFFGEEKCMQSYGYSSFIHLIYIGVIGSLSLVKKKYVWKGRKVT